MPEWRVEPGLTPYPDALAFMEARATAIRESGAAELIWLVEHPPLYTAGTSAQPSELLMAQRFPVYAAGRGGRYTYHGPGQRVAYVMLDLAERGRDIRRFVEALEGWVIGTLAGFGVEGRLIDGKIGVWVGSGSETAKIAAIGVRVRRWVSFHGLAINVSPDLEHFSGIVPCGLAEPVTSLQALGLAATMAEIDAALLQGLPQMLRSM
jgi:lipoyl(octanoyl) transferase